ncbi:MAG: molecular chaperone DnaJ [Patescibacteria group bacterium]
MASDYYDILGVSRTARQEEIKAAFRRLALEHHPDKGGDPAKFKKYNEAYQTLGNAETRAQYDRYGSTYEQMKSQGGFGGGGGAAGFQDFASAFGGGGAGFGDIGDILGGFGDIFGFGGKTASRKNARGRDMEMPVEIPFEESIHGATRDIDIEKTGRCQSCDGSGAAAGAKMISCKTCGGRGKVAHSTRSILGNIQTVAVCDSCHGRGERPEKLCNSCQGKGVTRVQKTLSVKIPAGISDGEIIRLSGEGEELGHGGKPGDFYINVRVRSHKTFERRGDDIWGGAFLDFKTAALGGVLDVPTVDGSVDLNIPAGTQSGQVFRIRSKGAPHLHSSGRGDHQVEVTIRVPEKLTRRQKEILEEWEG